MHDGQEITRHEEIADTSEKIVTFGQTADGEVIYAHWGNPATLHRLVRNPASTQPSVFPRRLSETGLFADTKALSPQDGVFEFAVAEPLWQNGMGAKRHIAIPGTAAIQTAIQRNKGGVVTNTKFTWPKESVLARTVSIAGTPPKPVETQVLHFDGETWNGYSYRWNQEGTDADWLGRTARTQSRAKAPIVFIAAPSACVVTRHGQALPWVSNRSSSSPFSKVMRPKPLCRWDWSMPLSLKPVPHDLRAVGMRKRISKPALVPGCTPTARTVIVKTAAARWRSN